MATTKASYTLEELKTFNVAVICNSQKEYEKIKMIDEPLYSDPVDFPIKYSLCIGLGWIEISNALYSQYYEDMGYTIINFDQIRFGKDHKEEDLKTPSTKEFIGWAFKPDKEKYIDAAKTICLLSGYNTDMTTMKHGQLFNVGSSIESVLKYEGLLDLWFDPVYQEYTIGDDCFILKGSNSMLKIGMVYKINNITTSPEGTFYHFNYNGDKESGAWLSKGCFRHATPTEQQKLTFKVPPKLPKIANSQCIDNGDETITCGCTTKSFGWIEGAHFVLTESDKSDIYIEGILVTTKLLGELVKYIEFKKTSVSN